MENIYYVQEFKAKYSKDINYPELIYSFNMIQAQKCLEVFKQVLQFL